MKFGISVVEDGGTYAKQPSKCNLVLRSNFDKIGKWNTTTVNASFETRDPIRIFIYFAIKFQTPIKILISLLFQSYIFFDIFPV